MSELELIAKIRALLERRDPRIALGIGDDAAILAALARPAVSVDAIVEGVHFDRRWLSWADVGWKGYAAALSDLAAMGARPVAGLIALVLPPSISDDDVLSIASGVAECADAFGAPVAGGNISRGAELSMTTTVIGEAPARPLTRAGAGEGEGIYVTGIVGAAALQLRHLAKDLRGVGDSKSRWQHPIPRFDISIADHATSCIDISDGLVADLSHICEQSRVGAIVELARLPLLADHHELAAAIGEDGVALALGGGEDYELLYTARESDAGTWIGTIVPGTGVKVIDADGRDVRVASAGFRHRT